MGEVTRDEFDRLVHRVTRVERTLGATGELVASEVVGLRTYLDERFAGFGTRFDHQDRMLDALATEVQVDVERLDRKLDGLATEVDRVDRKLGVLQADQGRKLDLLLMHFGLEPPA